jgi:hypothetical protein
LVDAESRILVISSILEPFAARTLRELSMTTEATASISVECDDGALVHDVPPASPTRSRAMKSLIEAVAKSIWEGGL